MKPSRIRKLARRYGAGELSLDEYRAQRRKLINSVTSGAQRIEYGEFSPARGKHPYLPWFLGIALLITAASIGISMWMEHVHELKNNNPQAASVPESGPELMSGFMDTSDWSDASLVQFLQRWKSLSPQEQKAAQHSYLFPRLISQLHEQIASQRAVVDLAAGENPKDDPVSMHLNHLRQLATALGVKSDN